MYVVAMPGWMPSLVKFAPKRASRFADADVADQREPEAAADRVPLQRADHRHLDLQDRQERAVHRERALVRQELARRAAVALCAGLEVGARAEALAAPGDDHAAQLGVLLRARDRAAQTLEHVVGHAVAVLGPVQRDRGDVVLALVENRGLAHFFAPASSLARNASVRSYAPSSTGVIAASKSVTPISRRRVISARRYFSSPASATSAGPAGALAVEHGAVRRQLTVDHELLADALARLGGLVRHDDREARDDARLGPARVLRRVAQHRDDVRRERLRTGHPGDRAVGQAPGELQHHRAERRDQDRHAASRRAPAAAPPRLYCSPSNFTPSPRQSGASTSRYSFMCRAGLSYENPSMSSITILCESPMPSEKRPLRRGLRGQRLLRDRDRMARVGRHDRGAELDAGWSRGRRCRAR